MRSVGNLALKRTSHKYNTGTVRTAFYCRVSTQHESQIGALDNQIQWCESILRDHPNWIKENIYIDKGISGTQAKKRDGFMQMIKSAEEGNIDLIVTRECSRFARNTVDSLQYTRYLDKIGVEVFFYTDNIWSFEGDGELRLTIMSALSQNESGHISERVLSGQSISRENGILYGNGNILGYRLVKGITSKDNTYEIIEEDAETVRMIFQFYLEGMGAKSIASKLVELHRKNASGKCRWDATQVLRTLNNKTYCGYVAYNKSYTTNFLEHTRKNVLDRSKHLYVKASFPAIISEETYEQVQKLKESKVTCFNGQRKGKKESSDRWIKVLRCQCGKSFKKFKWRVSSSGEECCGYSCYNVIRNRRKSFHAKYEDETELSEYCDVKALAEWKLDFMLQNILKRIWSNPQNIISSIIKSVEDNYMEETKSISSELERFTREKERIKVRMDNLLDMRLDGNINKAEYEKKYLQLNSRLEYLDSQLHSENVSNIDIEAQKDNMENTISQVKEFLSVFGDFDVKKLDDKIISSLVSRVTPTEDGVYKWYIGGGVVQNLFDDKDYILYDEFELDFETAKSYRKKYGNFIRRYQYQNLKVEVYIKK